MGNRRQLSICRDKEALGCRNCDRGNDVYRENVPSSSEADFEVGFLSGTGVCIYLICLAVPASGCKWTDFVILECRGCKVYPRNDDGRHVGNGRTGTM